MNNAARPQMQAVKRQGINAVYLMSQSRSDPRWMTYKQAARVGAQVRKGEKGTPVQYWKFSEEQTILDAQGERVKKTVVLERLRVFFATVFNAEQIEGLPQFERKKETWDPIERADEILKASGANIRHGENNRAFYRLATDTIHLPDKAQFPTADGYYATALHELGHWTGHESRLARDLSHPFGSDGYAREELRAEIASMILGEELGIGHDPGQHAAYVDSWIKQIEDDPLEIFRAAADAEKIQQHVLGFEQKQIQEESQVEDEEPTEFQLTPYQAELAQLLKLSTLTPGTYIPTEAVRSDNHAAVFVGEKPLSSAVQVTILNRSPKPRRWRQAPLCKLLIWQPASPAC
jgi:putative DNA primase/helicase